MLFVSDPKVALERAGITLAPRVHQWVERQLARHDAYDPLPAGTKVTAFTVELVDEPPRGADDHR